MKYARVRAIFTENDTHAGKISEKQAGAPTKIRDNAIIAAGSVVTKDVLPNTLVGGNPAKPLRKIS